MAPDIDGCERTFTPVLAVTLPPLLLLFAGGA